MPTTRRSAIVALELALSVCFLAFASPALARQLDAPASSPTEIRPLRLGSEGPAAQVQTLDGQAVDLRTITAGQPTLLLFYRGGW